MKNLVTLFLLLSLQISAQSKRDTVQPGYYATVDSAFKLVRVSIQKKGDPVLHVTDVEGKLTTVLIRQIVSLPKGSIVIYDENPHRSLSYIIGDTNTVPAERYQVTTTVMSRAQIANHVLDPNTICFDISMPVRNIYVSSHVNGNGIPLDLKTQIYGLRPGDRVVFENVKTRQADGSVRTTSFSYVVGK